MNKNTHRFRRKGIGLLISGEGKRLLRFGSQLRAQGTYNFLGRGSDLHTWQCPLVRWDVSGLVPPF